MNKRNTFIHSLLHNKQGNDSKKIIMNFINSNPNIFMCLYFQTKLI